MIHFTKKVWFMLVFQLADSLTQRYEIYLINTRKSTTILYLFFWKSEHLHYRLYNRSWYWVTRTIIRST